MEDPKSVEPADQARLQAFLQNVDPALLASLKRDERRRRRKLLLLSITGGLVMGSVIATILVLLLAPPPAAHPDAKQADQALALSSEGWQLWQRGKLDDAAKKFEEALKLDPTSANAANGLGWARLNAGDPSAAETAFKKCLEIQKDHPAALNGLGVIAYNRKDFTAAEKHWLAAAKDAPAAWVGLARLYLLQGKYADAEKYARLVSTTPGDDGIAQQLLQAAQAKTVSPALRAMIEPGAANGAGGDDITRAWALLNAGKPNQARELFESAVNKTPNDLAARNGLGFALLNLGKTRDAKAQFEACLKQDPKAAAPMNGLAVCLKSEGKTDEAIALWEKLVKAAPAPNAGTTGLAFTYLEQKNYAKALPYLEQLIKVAPDDPNLKQALAQAKAGAAEKP
jgi:tetratricopeptide (TPR) repeat protein